MFSMTVFDLFVEVSSGQRTSLDALALCQCIAFFQLEIGDALTLFAYLTTEYACGGMG